MFERMFAGPIAILYWGVGLWGFILVSQYIYQKLGWIGVIVGVLITPVAYLVAPLWAGFVDGYWTPALVCFAPIALAMILGIVGSVAESRQ